MICRRTLPLLFLAAAPAAADGFLLFQHGGRATGQAGAFTARADEPSAVRYNPAAIARFDGLQLQAGLDFQAPSDELESSGRTDSPEHVIQFPPALYLSYKPDGLAVPLAFGISIDAPFWSIQNWNPARFPARFDTIRQELTLFELRPTVAWAIDERWSVGGALRYVRGDLETSFATAESFRGLPPVVESAEVHSEAATDVDGLGFELALHFADQGWGAGLVISPGVELDGDGDVDHFLVDSTLGPGAEQDFFRRFPSGGASAGFELPPTATAGFWWTPVERLALEADLAWSGWSVVDRTPLALSTGDYAVTPAAVDRRRDWEDVVAVRLGGEWQFESGWAAGGGLAWEPSPVPDSTIEPGFPRGDAYVVAFGGSYDMEGLSFDLGYSYYLYEDRDAILRSSTPTGTLVPVRGTFSARAQVFSFSARWRW